MKDWLHRIFSCSLALLILVSTTSWTVGKHYCMGHLVDVSLFVEAKDCGMDMGDNSALTFEKNSCCDDQLIVVEGQEIVELSPEEIELDGQLHLPICTLHYVDLLQISEDSEAVGEHYPPPILVKDIQLLDEVFLL